MEQGLTFTPGSRRLIRGCFDTEAIRETAMMMHIIDERGVRRLADRQQIARRINLVVIFEREPRPDP